MIDLGVCLTSNLFHTLMSQAQHVHFFLKEQNSNEEIKTKNKRKKKCGTSIRQMLAALSCEQLGPHTQSCGSRPAPDSTTTSTTSHPRGRGRGAEMEGGTAPERWDSGRFTSTSSPCAALRFEPGLGGKLLRAAGEGTSYVLRHLKRHSPSTRHLHSQEVRKGSSRPTFSFLLLIRKWEKVLESSTNWLQRR